MSLCLPNHSLYAQLLLIQIWRFVLVLHPYLSRTHKWQKHGKGLRAIHARLFLVLGMQKDASLNDDTDLSLTKKQNGRPRINTKGKMHRSHKNPLLAAFLPNYKHVTFTNAYWLLHPKQGQPSVSLYQEDEAEKHVCVRERGLISLGVLHFGQLSIRVQPWKCM